MWVLGTTASNLDRITIINVSIVAKGLGSGSVALNSALRFAQDQDKKEVPRADPESRMNRRKILAIVAFMIAGFIAYTVIRNVSTPTTPNEVAPGESPGVEVPEPEPQPPHLAEQMKALVPAARATELHAAMTERYSLPDLPQGTGLLGVAGNPGEYFYTVNLEGTAQVWIMRSVSPTLLWETETDQILEIVGAHGTELLLKFIDEPFAGPAEAWQPGGFYALDMEAPGVGVYPSDLEPETVEIIRRTIR
jgi:hypothetical protein